MKKKFKLGVIGAGFMSTAIIKGVINANLINPKDIIVSDLSQSALDKMSENGVEVTNDNANLCSKAEFVLFAIKPQNLDSVLETIKGLDVNKFISIMAGVKKEKIKAVFPNSKVARCMPNTPCAIGYGAIGLDLFDYDNDEDILFIKTLFNLLGKVELVEEDKLNAVTGISGSAPAYFYLFLKGIVEAGVKNGLTYDQAKSLATSTMIGAGKMVENNKDKSLDELINAVCSKGGTTIEAVNTYNQAGLGKISQNAIDNCVKRAFELENL